MGESREEFKVSGKDLIEKIRELIKEGNVRRIIVRNENGKKITEIPLTFGVLGAIILPALAALGAVVVLAANYTIEVIKEN